MIPPKGDLYMTHMLGLGLNEAQVFFLNLSATLSDVGTGESVGGQ